MTVKGDARPERQSSWLRSLGRARGRLAGFSGPLQLSFAGFVLLHFTTQAFRAGTDGALPESGWERTPWLVGALLLLFWLPFTVFGVAQLSRSLTRGRLPAASQERALAVVEVLSLALLLLFGALHGALMAWPLLSGSLTEIDLRPELAASLSSTWRGWPVQGIVYLCAVGAASFYAARLTLAALAAARPGSLWTRVIIGLAVLCHLLGSYAVIRCGSGSFLP